MFLVVSFWMIILRLYFHPILDVSCDPSLDENLRFYIFIQYWMFLVIQISIGNHMNSSAIWEIIALSHVLEGRVITRGEAEWNLSF